MQTRSRHHVNAQMIKRRIISESMFGGYFRLLFVLSFGVSTMRNYRTTMRGCFLLISLSLFGLAIAAVRYDNYKVLRISPQTEADLLWVNTLAEVWENRVDIWKHPRQVGSPVDVMVAPHWQTEFFDVLNDQGIKYSEMVSTIS
ncbi:carboxypeptidase A1-like [Strongylocentrotus purpuratus]|uniref:Carboxypeptidase activation peptide domain-containing protein n=1 Tax=Strongylocentrotus purpuratus TaxID=7668 RepID=A0A7M7NRL5_STRPU|nr:carboxypeptidase A1-like [Strongylocentrotus purpuratus]